MYGGLGDLGFYTISKVKIDLKPNLNINFCLKPNIKPYTKIPKCLNQSIYLLLKRMPRNLYNFVYTFQTIYAFHL